jgi:hypothetical protein
MAIPAVGGHGGGIPTRKEAVQMSGFRRVIAWLLVSILVLSLVATLVVGEAA